MNFRFKALAQLREPDELDSPVVLASPKGWLVIASLTVVTVTAIGWALLGRLPQTVSATGLITRPQGAIQVESLYTGLVGKVHTAVGGYVKAGQDLVDIRDAGGATHEIVSPLAGQVTSLGVSAGEVVSTGSSVATVERATGGGQLVAMLFVPSDQAAQIVPGESVGLNVESAPSAAFGLLRGRVVSVSQFPLTTAEVNAVLGGAATAGTFAAGVAPRLVTVSLQKDSRTASGYAWTTAAGPPGPLPDQVSAAGTVTLGSQAPISLLFSR
ncbi:MAG TPA: HlyD family efflux transporter periplasmic adaptor subunit [Streptosporangiaceae bacterium]|jgi:multidrug efflux pump subunit AcrA (membrane-fusion protein)